jgi:uncharacterized membrane protein
MQNPPPGQYGYSAPTGGAGEKSSTGLDANVAALISYIFVPILGIVFYLIEKNSRFVKFHAMQSILFGAAWIVIWIGLSIVSGVLAAVHLGILNLLLLPIELIVGLGFFILWILAAIKAWQGQMYKLPIIGNIAENMANK